MYVNKLFIRYVFKGVEARYLPIVTSPIDIFFYHKVCSKTFAHPSNSLR
jgi:hypothetical protein